MIFYFSGTGNSRRIALYLSERLGETIQSIDWNTGFDSILYKSETLGFVFPIYAWGLPRVMEDFLKRLPSCPAGRTPYIYSVMTCGDDIGRTDRLLRKMLATKGLTLSAAFSIQMRNTYVCLPGFDTDSIEAVRQKEEKGVIRIKEITESIRQHRHSTEADITPGGTPWLKTYVLRPLFNALLIDERHFHCDASLCSHCGRCEKVCPLDNIALSAEKTPRWKGHCTHCLACYHCCPKHAIGYGFFTKHKGQVKINA